jgi:hypothetical protein
MSVPCNSIARLSFAPLCLCKSILFLALPLLYLSSHRVAMQYEAIPLQSESCRVYAIPLHICSILCIAFAALLRAPPCHCAAPHSDTKQCRCEAFLHIAFAVQDADAQSHSG